MDRHAPFAPAWVRDPLARTVAVSVPDILEACGGLQRLVRTLARLTNVELFIINADYLCIAGSGPYEAAVGCVSPTDTAIGYSLASGRPTMVTDPRANEACRDCSQRTACRDVANYTAPIAVAGRTVAAVQIVAFDSAQCAALGEKAEDLAETITLFLVPMCEADARLLAALGGGDDKAESGAGLERIVGESQVMRALKDDIIRCAPLDSTVLLQGESGTGKELVAQAIHDLSPRTAGPFVAVNCGAIPEAIIESELFGYASGTFTGAQRGGKPGLFEHAHGGTLFLDEIAELPLPLQVKLLRVLQERKVMRLGGRKEHSFDVRIIAAANVDLAGMTRSGRFRQDLYYRLSVIPLRVPALHDRDGDIELLVNHFVRHYARRRGETPPLVETELMDRFKSYTWPGNVRELKNFVEYGVNFRQGRKLGLATLAARFSGNDDTSPSSQCAGWPKEVELGCSGPTTPPIPPNPPTPTADLTEQKALRDALARFGTSLEGKRRVAEHLNISLATLYRKLKRHGSLDAYRYSVGSDAN